MTEIAGRAAVVTGAGSGIGMGLAKELARRGASVAVSDILLDNAQRVAAEINTAGGKAVPIHCDVCERDSIRRLKSEANAALGPIQLLFANAGATSFDAVLDVSDNDVDWIVQVNLLGVINTIRAFLPDMITGREGHIVATSSMAGLLPGWIPLHSLYSAAKMGVIGMMMNLALETKAHGIHTTIYCPGGVATGMATNNARYRPARFGGPGQGPIRIPEASHKNNPINFYSPDGVAPMVLRAVQGNRPFVFDHADQRRFFRETYRDVVESCYDDIEAYERGVGIPPVVRSTWGGEKK
jgi:NAD(P)-dependent dehydrogenase (short-subunit alcohol dehydrogenase family)